MSTEYIKFNKRNLGRRPMGKKQRTIAPCIDCGVVSDHLVKEYCPKCYRKHKPKKENYLDLLISHHNH